MKKEDLDYGKDRMDVGGGGRYRTWHRSLTECVLDHLTQGPDEVASVGNITGPHVRHQPTIHRKIHRRVPRHLSQSTVEARGCSWYTRLCLVPGRIMDVHGVAMSAFRGTFSRVSRRSLVTQIGSRTSSNKVLVAFRQGWKEIFWPSGW